MVKHRITLGVNGRLYQVTVEPRKTLADTLREDCNLTATHLGCEHGVCGACTVLMNGQPVRSCLIFAVQCEQSSIRTVEGLRSEGSFHLLQEAFKRNHALQCGFCTPGFLMLLVGVLEQNPAMEEEQLREVLSSNLCRCTGNTSILRAATEVALAYREMFDDLV